MAELHQNTKYPQNTVLCRCRALREFYHIEKERLGKPIYYAPRVPTAVSTH